MSFGTGLSGLNASTKNLDVIGHNIANANTTGMKAGRAEFAEMYASALGAAGGSNGGIGVSVATVSQQFSQGNIKVTGNSLDMAVNGDGFFKVSQTDGSVAYTRNGEFKLDKDGNIVTNTDAKLQGYMPDSVGGVITAGRTQTLTLPTGALIAPKATGSDATAPGISITANLNANAEIQPAVASPTALTAEQKAYGTSLNVYDTEGNAVPMQLYFVRDDAANPSTWAVVGEVVNKDTNAVTTFDVGSVTFDTNGQPAAATALSVAVGSIPANSYSTGVPVAALNAIPINVGNDQDGWQLSQYGTNFSVYDLKQDGYSAGELTSIDIGEDGVITAQYSNGTSQDAGQIALTRFRNVQGLESINGGYWQESAASGQPVEGQPQTGRFGQVRSGSLEESNVDLTAELVNMIVAQRSYQANAQTIKTQDQVLTTLVNLR